MPTIGVIVALRHRLITLMVMLSTVAATVLSWKSQRFSAAGHRISSA